MGKRILLADDSMTIQKLVEMAFVDTDHELVCLSQGQEAWEKMAEFHPDVVLADAIMPVLDGYSLCERIKQSPQFAHTPVVLLTGRFQPFDESRAKEVGIDSRMMKPFVQEQLVELVERLAEEANPPVTDFDQDTGPVDDEPIDLPEDSFFEDEDLEPIEGDFLEPDSMDETESLDDLVAQPSPIVDSNTTIRVDQDELRSYLKQNRQLDFEEGTEEEESEDALDLGSVDEFGSEDDFLSESETQDTMETGVSSDTHPGGEAIDEEEEPELLENEASIEELNDEVVEDLNEELEEDAVEDLGDDLGDDLGEDLEGDMLDLEDAEFLGDDNSDNWEDILDDENVEELEDIGDLVEGSEFDSAAELQEDSVEEPEEDELKWGEVDEPIEEGPAVVVEDDSTVAIEREEMDSILTEEEKGLETPDSEDEIEPERLEPDEPVFDETSEEDEIFSGEDHEFEPGFMEKDTLPLGDLEEEEGLDFDEEPDTVPLNEEEPEILESGEELEITEPMVIEEAPEPIEALELEDEPMVLEEESDFGSDGENEEAEEWGDALEEMPDEPVDDLNLDPEEELELEEEELIREELQVEPEALEEEFEPDEQVVATEIEQAGDEEPAVEHEDLEDVDEEIKEVDEEFEDIDEPIFSEVDIEPLEQPESALSDELEIELGSTQEAEQEAELAWDEETTEEAPAGQSQDEVLDLEEPAPEEQDATEDTTLEELPEVVAEADTEMVLEDVEDIDLTLSEPEDIEISEGLELPSDESPTEELEDLGPDEEDLIAEPEPVNWDQPTPEESVDVVEEVPVLEHDSVEVEWSDETVEGEEGVDLVTSGKELEIPTGSRVQTADLSDEQLEILADKVVKKLVNILSTDAVREVAWEVVPALAEVMVERRLFELENESE